MSKKHKINKFRPARKRQKETVGQLEFQNVVYLDREMVDDPEKPGKKKVQVYAVCTCNRWRSSKEATTLIKVGMEAKKHVDEGDCVLRFHDVPDDMSGDETLEEMEEKVAEKPVIEVDPTTEG